VSGAVREGILRTIMAQQVALEFAIERGNVAMQCYIAHRMAELEAVLYGSDNVRD
jgi:hypothetical protein